MKLQHSEIKPINQIRDEGFRALMKTFGPEDAIRFINSYEQGSGNYTEEKYQRPYEDFDTVVEMIRNRKKIDSY